MFGIEVDVITCLPSYRAPFRRFRYSGFRHSGGVEENRLKRCLKGGGVDSDTCGGGWICLSVAGCVTHKHLWKLIHDLKKS